MNKYRRELRSVARDTIGGLLCQKMYALAEDTLKLYDQQFKVDRFSRRSWDKILEHRLEVEGEVEENV